MNAVDRCVEMAALRSIADAFLHAFSCQMSSGQCVDGTSELDLLACRKWFLRFSFDVYTSNGRDGR